MAPIVAVVAWLMTGSVIMLALAGTAPLGALVTAWEGKRRRRRDWFRQLEQWRASVDEAASGIRREHREAVRAFAAQIATASEDGHGSVLVPIGTTDLHAPVEADAGGTPAMCDDERIATSQREADAQLHRVRAQLQRVAHAPVALVLTPRSQAAVVGPRVLAAAVVHGIAAGVGGSVSVGRYPSVSVSAGTGTGTDAAVTLRARPQVESDDSVQVLVRPDGHLRVAGARLLGPFGPVDAEAAFVQPALAPAPGVRSIDPGGLSLSEAILGLDQAVFRVPVGVAIGGSDHEADLLWLDLLRDGPHALVGGTTGSGKTEFLITWLVALAAVHSPNELGLLLIDFKGGSGFAPVESLPHCLGLVTDLDAAEATRVVDSLAAELRRRERVMRDLGVRTADEAHLPRLVVAIDEYAALRDLVPSAAERLTDVAARGRSLGVHLIIATQRPLGVVGDALLANVALRVLLRVHDAHESTAVVGSPVAAEFPASQPGLAAIRTADGLRQGQILPADPALLARAHAAAPSTTPRPWLPPLPPELPLEAALVQARSETGDAGAEVRSDRAILLGLCDDPAEQRQPGLWYEPDAGPLLILGGPRSGRSTALRTIAAQARGSILITDAATLWDWCDPLRPMPTAPVLIDDLDRILSGAPAEFRAALEQRCLDTLPRLGRAGGVVLTAGRSTGLGAIASLSTEQVLLRYPMLADYLAAGGTTAQHDPRPRPGAAVARGLTAQLAMAEAAIAVAAPDVVRLPDRGPVAVVTADPVRVLARLRQLGLQADDVETALGSSDPLAQVSAATLESGSGELRLIVLGPDQVQARWALWQQMQARLPIVWFQIGLAQYRMLSGDPQLPPPVLGTDQGWLRLPGQAVQRLRWPQSSVG